MGDIEKDVIPEEKKPFESPYDEYEERAEFKWLFWRDD